MTELPQVSPDDVLYWVRTTCLRPDYEVLAALGYKVDIAFQTEKRYHGPLTVKQQVWVINDYFENNIVYKPCDCLTPTPDRPIYYLEDRSNGESGLVVFQTTCLKSALIEFIRCCWDIDKTPKYDSEAKEWILPDVKHQVCSGTDMALIVRHNKFDFRFGCRSSSIVPVSNKWSPRDLVDISEEEQKLCQDLNQHPILTSFRNAIKSKWSEDEPLVVLCYCCDCFVCHDIKYVGLY